MSAGAIHTITHAQSDMRTLKEEVYGTDYRDLEDARSRIGEFWSRHITGKGCILRYDI